MLFSSEFRERLFNWVRVYRDRTQQNVSSLWLIMRMCPSFYEGGKPRPLPDLPPANKKDADLLDECFREFGRYCPRERLLIHLVWFKNYRPRIIKLRTGIFCSDQERQLARAEKMFQALVERTEFYRRQDGSN